MMLLFDVFESKMRLNCGNIMRIEIKLNKVNK